MIFLYLCQRLGILGSNNLPYVLVLELSLATSPFYPLIIYWLFLSLISSKCIFAFRAAIYIWLFVTFPSFFGC